MRSTLALLTALVALLVACDQPADAPATDAPTRTPAVEVTDTPTETAEATASPAATVGPTAAPTSTSGPAATQTATAEPTPTPPPLPTEHEPPDPGRRSGIPEVDAVIEAIVSDDAAALAVLAEPRQHPCRTTSGLGGQPPCEEGEETGTEVVVFPYGACELEWRRDIEQTLTQFLREVEGGVYAVLEAPEDDDEWVTYGDYIAVFQSEPPSELAPPAGYGVFIDDAGRVVYITAVCFGPPEEFLNWRGEEMTTLLEPPSLLGTRTGIPAVDAVIEAVEAGDGDTLASMVVYHETECVEQADVGSPPQCEPGEEEGTLVEVFPLAFCEGTYTRDAEEAARDFVEEQPTVAGVLGLHEPQADGAWPATEYLVVFEVEGEPQGRAVMVTDGEVVGLWPGPCASADDILRRDDVILRGPEVGNVD